MSPVDGSGALSPRILSVVLHWTPAGLLWLSASVLFLAVVIKETRAAAPSWRRLLIAWDWRAWSVLALLTLFLGVGFLTASANSPTYDEADHYKYARNILAGDASRFEDSEMPISVLNALPERLASFLPQGGVRDRLSSLLAARLVTVVFAAATALLVFWWSRALYGAVPAIASLFLFVLDPNIFAHAALVTTDIYALGTIAFAFYCLWRVSQHRTYGNGLLCAVALGISLLSKYTAVVLFPLFLVLLLLRDRRDIGTACREEGVRAMARYARRYITWGLIAIVISIVIINVGFLFYRTFTPFGYYSFRSDLFKTIQRELPALGSVPVPVPYPYLEGLDWVMHLDKTGQSFGQIYLLGEMRASGGFKGYYLVASLFKNPIPIQVVTVGAIAWYLLSRRRRASFVRDEMFLVVPMCAFAFYFNFMNDAQIGIRYYLVITPLLCVFAGHLFTSYRSFTLIPRAACVALGAWLVLSVFSYHPHYLSYFNELVWNRTTAYKYLADSNIDWGQDSGRVKAYVSANPDAVYRPSRQESGHLIVSVNDLVGIHGNRSEFAWLRNNFEPVGTIGYSHLIYHISPEQLAAVCALNVVCAD